MGVVDDNALACTYAALILHDSEKNIDAATIDKILEAAKVKVTGFYPCMFEKALKGADVAGLLKSAITVGGGGGGGGGGGAAPAAAAGGAAPAAAAKAPEPEEEAEEDMGFSLFD